jgi:hypothetical protein
MDHSPTTSERSESPLSYRCSSSPLDKTKIEVRPTLCSILSLPLFVRHLRCLSLAFKGAEGAFCSFSRSRARSFEGEEAGGGRLRLPLSGRDKGRRVTDRVRDRPLVGRVVLLSWDGSNGWLCWHMPTIAAL